MFQEFCISVLILVQTYIDSDANALSSFSLIWTILMNLLKLYIYTRFWLMAHRIKSIASYQSNHGFKFIKTVLSLAVFNQVYQTLYLLIGLLMYLEVIDDIVDDSVWYDMALRPWKQIVQIVTKELQSILIYMIIYYALSKIDNAAASDTDW